jgi:hypothetical protein
MPAGGKRTGLGLAIADHARDHQIRVVEGGAVCVHQRKPSSPPSWIDPGVSAAT